jgi:hypothetical protein
LTLVETPFQLVTTVLIQVETTVPAQTRSKAHTASVSHICREHHGPDHCSRRVPCMKEAANRN